MGLFSRKPDLVGIDRKLGVVSIVLVGVEVLVLPWFLERGALIFWVIIVLGHWLTLFYNIRVRELVISKDSDDKVLFGDRTEGSVSSVTMNEVVNNEIINGSSNQNDIQKNEEPAYEFLSLDDIIERGFKAKTANQFESARDWFLKALVLCPPVDLAIYLLIDLYWLSVKLKKETEAKELVLSFFEAYLTDLTTQQRIDLKNWLVKEGLYEMTISKIGRNELL